MSCAPRFWAQKTAKKSFSQRGKLLGLAKKNLWSLTMERLPPLNAIKAFEVAARTGSFTLGRDRAWRVLGGGQPADPQSRNLVRQAAVRAQRQSHHADRRRPCHLSADGAGAGRHRGDRPAHAGRRLADAPCRQRAVLAGRTVAGAETGRASRSPSRRWRSMSGSRTIRST